MRLLIVAANNSNTAKVTPEIIRVLTALLSVGLYWLCYIGMFFFFPLGARQCHSRSVKSSSHSTVFRPEPGEP